MNHLASVSITISSNT